MHESQTDYVFCSTPLTSQYTRAPDPALRLDHKYLVTEIGLRPSESSASTPRLNQHRYIPISDIDPQIMQGTLLSEAWPRRPLNLLLYKSGHGKVIDLGKYRHQRLLKLH